MAPLIQTQADIETQVTVSSSIEALAPTQIVTPTPTFSQPNMVLFSKEIPISLNEKIKEKINA